MEIALEISVPNLPDFQIFHYFVLQFIKLRFVFLRVAESIASVASSISLSVFRFSATGMSSKEVENKLQIFIFISVEN